MEILNYYIQIVFGFLKVRAGVQKTLLNLNCVVACLFMGFAWSNAEGSVTPTLVDALVDALEPQAAAIC